MPHPHKIREMIECCTKGDPDKAVLILNGLWKQGYSALDIVGTLFKVLKTFDMPEFLKLEFIKVSYIGSLSFRP
jgi:replication factor C subunit 2/4